MSQSDVKKVLNTFLIEIENHLILGNSVMLMGFGKFDTRKRAKRHFFSAVANRQVSVPSRVAPVFRSSNSLERKVAKGFE
jgi:nucleoid DNA-binding protein